MKDELRTLWRSQDIADARAQHGLRLYELLHEVQKHLGGGGLHTHKVVRRHELELEAVEAIWIEVKGGGESLLVCNVYRPPNANAEWMDDVEAMIENPLTGG